MSKKNYFFNSPDNIIPESLSTAILKENKALDFHKNQDNYSPTPLFELSHLSKTLGVGKIYIKDESYRMGLNAFKGVGACYAVEQIIRNNKEFNTLCTATDGNHGRAVARSANQAGKYAVVFVPSGTSIERIKSIKDEGADVRVIDGNYDEACRVAAENCRKEGWILVQDTASPGYEEIPAYIMAGYLTIFQEMETNLNILPAPETDLVILQAGVGSFAASATWYYLNRYGTGRPKILIVEPADADAVINSLEAEKWSTSKAPGKTIMAGLNCNTPSTSGLEIIKHGADAAIRITDRYTRLAIRKLYHRTEYDKQVLSGESGAAGLAGLLAILTDPVYKPVLDILKINNTTRVLLVNTEGPTDKESFNKIISLKC